MVHLMLTEGHYRKLIERLQAGWPTPPHVRCACWSGARLAPHGEPKGECSSGRKCQASAMPRAWPATLQHRASCSHRAQFSARSSSPRPSCASTPPMRSTKRLERYLLKGCRVPSAADLPVSAIPDQAAVLGRLDGMRVVAVEAREVAICSADTCTGCRITSHNTSSVPGGVVGGPIWEKYAVSWQKAPGSISVEGMARHLVRQERM